MDKCSECQRGSLSSFFESRLGICADCCALLVEKVRKLAPEHAELRQKHELVNETIKVYESMLSAEKSGMESAQKGFGVDQNPHPENSRESLAWVSGWATGELQRRAGQATAVIEWAVLNLDVVEQLASGYGQQEIAGKLEVIEEKLAQFVEVR